LCWAVNVPRRVRGLIKNGYSALNSKHMEDINRTAATLYVCFSGQLQSSVVDVFFFFFNPIHYEHR